MDAEQTLDYAVTYAGLDGWSGAACSGQCAVSSEQKAGPASGRSIPPTLFPDSPAPSNTEARPPDSNPVTGQDRVSEQKDPPGRGRKRQRFKPRERRLRDLGVSSYVRDHYITEKGLADSTAGLVNDCLTHVTRSRGELRVKGLTLELLFDMRDYFLGLIADGDLKPATANKHLRQLRAIANHAATDRLVKPVLFRKMFIVPKPNPEAWTAEQYQKIEAASRVVTGSVGKVPAAVWWCAWWRTISRAGCRISAMMLAARGDYRNGVLWLRAENQKQDEDQRIALPPRSCLAVEELLHAHDDARLFPWPYDHVPEGSKTNWKTLFNHFQKLLLDPCGITVPSGVKTRMCRRTAATVVQESGGSGQRLCGHKSAWHDQHALYPARSRTGDEGCALDPGGRRGRAAQPLSEGRRAMTAILKFLGPARRLLRIREQVGRLRKVEGIFAIAGPAYAVTVTFDLLESGKRLAIEIDRAAWDEIRERVDRAFVF